MVRRENDKPPGCIYVRKMRYWWRGRLPGEEKIRPCKITPRNSDKAVLATPDNLELAREIVWAWWKQAAAQAEGKSRRALTVRELVAIYLAHCETYYRRADGTPTGEAENIELALRPLVSKYGNLPADAIDVEHVEAMQKLLAGELARTPVAAKQQGTKFDGKQFVTTIVLSDLDNHGPIAQQLKRMNANA